MDRVISLEKNNRAQIQSIKEVIEKTNSAIHKNNEQFQEMKSLIKGL